MEFHEAMHAKCRFDACKIPPHQHFQFGIGNVSRGDQKQAGWLPGKQERLHKIIILGYHDALLTANSSNHFGIWRAIARWKIQSVLRVMPGLGEPKRHASGQLRIDQEFHAARNSICFTCARRAA